MTMRLSGTVMEIWRRKTCTQTDTHNDGQIDQSHNLLQCPLRSLGGNNDDSHAANAELAGVSCGVSADAARSGAKRRRTTGT